MPSIERLQIALVVFAGGGAVRVIEYFRLRDSIIAVTVQTRRTIRMLDGRLGARLVQVHIAAERLARRRRTTARREATARVLFVVVHGQNER